MSRASREELGYRHVRLYIDHLDNEDGRVWAVDCAGDQLRRRRYVRATSVSIHGAPMSSDSTVFRPGKRQPKAWIAISGDVQVLTHRATGTVHVTIRR